MRLSVLGLGRMGQAFAGRLLEKGHEVTVWNRSPGKADELVQKGAREAGGLAEAASSATIVFSSLANDDAVKEIALGGGGVLGALQGDALYVDCSTVSAALAYELAERFGAERFVSMPILGAPEAVSSGKAIYLAGGPKAALNRLGALFSDLTSTVRYYDQAPLAAVAKVTSNLLLLTSVVGLAESFAVGRAGGLDDDQLRALLSESPMLAPGIKNRFEGVLTGKQKPWWTAELGAKDAGLAREVASSKRLSLPVADVVQERYETLAEKDDSVDIAEVGTLYSR